MSLEQKNLSIPYFSAKGSFFPENTRKCEKMLNIFLNQAEDIKLFGKLKGLIVPHAGYIYSGPVAAYGYKQAKKARDFTKEVTVIGPSHQAFFQGYIRGVRDHSVEVQIPFIKKTLPDATIRTYVLGNINAEKFAEELLQQVNKNSIIIASSDLSHFHPYNEAIAIDKIANHAVPALDFETVYKDVEACGKNAILTLMYISKKKGWKGQFLKYSNSGDTSGDKSQVVGYGCYAFVK